MVLNNGFEYYVMLFIILVIFGVGSVIGGGTITIVGKGFVLGAIVSVGPNDVIGVVFVDFKIL